MIPLRDQEALRLRFQRDLASRVRLDLFTQRRSTIYVPGREECLYCDEAQTLLEELASLSGRISLSVHQLSQAAPLAKELGVDKVPGIVIRGQANRPLRFFGLPSGGQFAGFVEAIIEAARGSVDLAAESIKQLRKLKTDVRLQVFVTPACAYSPPVARIAFKLGLQSVRVKADVIEIAEFPSIIERHALRATPTTLIGESLALLGAIDEATLVRSIMRVAEGRPQAGEAKPGAATPLVTPGQQQQPASVTTGSGLIIPR
jgi:glutaredoxin-like protein